MDLLVIVRHGNYGADDRLNDLGRDQMRHLAELVRPDLAGRAVRLLSSTALRAVDSAEVLAQALALASFERHDLLWSDNRHREDYAAALALIREKSEGVDVLLVVTHLEYAGYLPTLFGKEVLQTCITERELRRGQGRSIRCVEKTATVLG
ncbi:hypothetical protein EPO34_03190 [Patescibacteria group bacterium]|nr:MAG: hypothetical protein EPO34_03190 [Patescibacteria group bacterium]